MNKFILSLLLMISFFVLVSCEDLFRLLEPPDISDSEEVYRVKRIDFFNNDTTHLSGREEYMYDDFEKVNLVVFSADMMGDGTLTEHGQTLYEYDQDTIISSYYMDSTKSSITKYVVVNDKLLKEIEMWREVDGTWFTETVIEYYYDSDKLINEKYYENNGSGLEFSSERKMYYSGENMTSIEYFSDWWQDNTEENVKTNEELFYYSEGKLDSIESNNLQSDMSFMITGKQVFTYTNDRLSTLIYRYYNSSDSIWTESFRKEYHYNQDNRLTEQYTLFPTGNATKTIYAWENEKGNVGVFSGIQYYRYLGLPVLKSVEATDGILFEHPDLK